MSVLEIAPSGRMRSVQLIESGPLEHVVESAPSDLPPQSSVLIEAYDRHDMESKLDDAVADAIQEAHLTGSGLGILVTRYDHFNFTVSFTRTVPHGEILEDDRRGGAAFVSQSKGWKQ